MTNFSYVNKGKTLKINGKCVVRDNTFSHGYLSLLVEKSNSLDSV